MPAPRGSVLRQRLTVLLPLALVVFVAFELVSYLRRKPALSVGAPGAPGAPLVTVPLKSAPPPAVPRVWTGVSTPLDVAAGDKIIIWTRVDPMTPSRLAELGTVMLAVQLKSPVESSLIGLCPMLKGGGTAWTEPCGDASANVCLRTVTECDITATIPGKFTLEASVEWLPGKEPETASLEAFIVRAR